MEKWDLYNKDRQCLGITKNRGEVLEEGEYHMVVGIWTFNTKGEMLITLRHPDKEHSPNLWENTGGCVQAGEESRAGAVRELFEETGISVQQDELTLIETQIHGNTIVDTYMVSVDHEAQTLVFQEGETVDGKWVSIEIFEQMVEEGLFVNALVRKFERLKETLKRYIL